jgi:DNA-binding GntR family transcriptional regulator
MLTRVDTRRAYQQLFEQITRLEIEPNQTLDPEHIARELGIAEKAVREALWLLAYDELILVEDVRYIVTRIRKEDLTSLSELRSLLESCSARLAAERATPDDLAIMEALRIESSQIEGSDHVTLFELDSKFHRAIARAAKNKNLQRSLDRYYGLSRRLWFLVIQDLEFLPSAVSEHYQLLQAIRDGNSSRAAKLMREHVQAFYRKVEEIFKETDGGR